MLFSVLPDTSTGAGVSVESSVITSVVSVRSVSAFVSLCPASASVAVDVFSASTVVDISSASAAVDVVSASVILVVDSDSPELSDPQANRLKEIVAVINTGRIVFLICVILIFYIGIIIIYHDSHLRCLTLLRNYYDQIVAENGDMATGFF